MNATDLVIECGTVARVLGKSQVSVEFAGQEAWNNGKVIRLPELPVGQIDAEMVAMMRGYTDHETAHSLFTDMDFFNTLDPDFATNVNYLEDPRAEAAYQRQYPGAWASLNAMRQVSAQRQLDELAKVPPHLLDWRELIFGAVKWTASQMMGHGGDTQRTLVAVIPEQYRHIAEDFAKRAMTAGSTQEVTELAKELRDLMGREDEKHERDESQEDGEEEEQEEERRKSEGQGGGKKQAPLIDEAAILGCMASTQKGQPRYNPQLFVYDHTSAPVQFVNTMAKEKVTISPMGSHAKSILKRALLGVDDSRWLGGQVTGLLDPNDLVRAYNGEDDVYRQRTKEPELDTAVTLLIDMSSSMRGERIQRATQTALMLGDALAALGVRLSILGHTTMALHNYLLYPKTDVAQVFEWMYQNINPNLANFKFQNVDQRGMKMRGGQSGATVEREMRVAMRRYRNGDTLEPHHLRAIGSSLGCAPNCISSDPLVIFDLLGFDGRIKHTRDVIERLPSLVDWFGCNNIDPRAIEYAVNKIRVCKQSKKIVLMLCDGIPFARGILSNQLNKYTIEADIEAMKQSVTIIAVGFGESKVADIFQTHVALGSIGHMEDVVLSVVSKVLKTTQKGTGRTILNRKG